jgi:hypothetical protein
MNIESLLLKEKKAKALNVKLQWVAGGIATAGMVTGITIISLALAPAGLMLAASAVPGAFSACVAGGGAGALAAKCASSANMQKGAAMHNNAEILHKASSGSQEQLPRAIVLFAEAMGRLSEFFTTFGASIRDIERTAERIECQLKREAELDK